LKGEPVNKPLREFYFSESAVAQWKILKLFEWS
jgi:hypothetical protein